MSGKINFESKIKRNVVDQAKREVLSSGYGIVMKYDPATNSAIVLMSRPDSDAPSELLHDVPCPTNIGVQGTAPERGRPCWVDFKNGDHSFPVITTFFNHRYDQIDEFRQNYAPAPLPTYVYNL